MQLRYTVNDHATYCTCPLLGFSTAKTNCAILMLWFQFRRVVLSNKRKLFYYYKKKIFGFQIRRLCSLEAVSFSGLTTVHVYKN